MKKLLFAFISLVGLLLVIPNTGFAQESKDVYYTVKSGDSLSVIAEKYDTTFFTIQNNNKDKIPDVNIVSEGEIILVSGENYDNSLVIPKIQREPILNTAETREKPSNYSSPRYAAEKVALKTGTDISTWLYIIEKESSNDPTITNSIGCYGYFQIHPTRGMPANADVDTQIEYAVRIYNSEGFNAWEVM